MEFDLESLVRREFLHHAWSIMYQTLMSSILLLEGGSLMYWGSGTSIESLSQLYMLECNSNKQKRKDSKLQVTWRKIHRMASPTSPESHQLGGSDANGSTLGSSWRYVKRYSRTWFKIVETIFHIDRFRNFNKYYSAKAQQHRKSCGSLYQNDGWKASNRSRELTCWSLKPETFKESIPSKSHQPQSMENNPFALTDPLGWHFSF